MGNVYIRLHFPPGAEDEAADVSVRPLLKHWAPNSCPHVGEFIEFEGVPYVVIRITHRVETKEVDVFLGRVAVHG